MPRLLRKQKIRGVTGAVPPPATSSGFIVDDVASEDLVSTHSAVIWYAKLTDHTSAFNDFDMHVDYSAHVLPDSTQVSGMKLQYVSVPEIGANVSGVRWKTMSITPFTEFAGGDGSTIMNWKKYLNTSTASNSSRAVSTGEVKELWVRYCFMAESTVWLGFNEEGFKLSGLDNFAQADGAGGGIHAGTYMWHHPPNTSTSTIALNTYWYGINLDELNGGNGYQVFTSSQYPVILKDTWHCIEQHWKINTMNGATPNNDAELQVWFDDDLVFTSSNFAHTENTSSNEIKVFWFQLFHGGSNTPLTPIYYKVAAACMSSTRRIGMPKSLR